MNNIKNNSMQRLISAGDNHTVGVRSDGTVAAAGIMNGVGGGKFDSKGNYTREQSIVTLMRMSLTPSN